MPGSSEEKSAKLAAKGVGSQDVILGVRPEHTQLVFDKAENTIEGTLRVNEMMGSELHLHLYTEDGTRLIVRVPTIQLSASQRANLSAGATLYITFEDKVMYFFDPESQENILFG